MRYTLAIVVFCLVPAAPGQVAITEFLNNPDGTDKGREWVELFNYCPRPVDLAGWTLQDKGHDSYEFPQLILPPGGYLIVACGAIGNVDAAIAKAIFQVEWLNGRKSRLVVGVEGIVLANGADELVLRDPCGEAVWCVAWSNDETPRFATFLTESSGFLIDAFGTKKAPGVVRHGSDNGLEGFMGYEENDTTPDAYARPSDISGLVAAFGKDFANVNKPSVGSPLRGGYAMLSPGDLDADGSVNGWDLMTLLLAWGRCPGPCTCPGDVDGDGAVGVVDLLLLLSAWG